MKINKWHIFTFIILLLVVVYKIMNIQYYEDLDKNFVYKVATLNEVKYIGRSASNRIIFTYNLDSEIKKGSDNFINDSSRYYESQIGKKYLVKMSDKQWVNRFFYTYKLYMNKPVPDSVEEPAEGWKVLPNWARE